VKGKEGDDRLDILFTLILILLILLIVSPETVGKVLAFLEEKIKKALDSKDKHKFLD